MVDPIMITISYDERSGCSLSVTGKRLCRGGHLRSSLWLGGNVLPSFSWGRTSHSRSLSRSTHEANKPSRRLMYGALCSVSTGITMHRPPIAAKTQANSLRAKVFSHGLLTSNLVQLKHAALLLLLLVVLLPGVITIDSFSYFAFRPNTAGQ